MWVCIYNRHILKFKSFFLSSERIRHVMTFNFDDFVDLILSFTIFDKIGSVFGFNVLCYDFVEVGKCSLKACKLQPKGLQ